MELILLLPLILVLVVLAVAFWIVVRAISVTYKAAAWTVDAAIGGKRSRRRRQAARERCANDRCNAAWRKDARFCHRCGEPRHANLPALAGPRAA